MAVISLLALCALTASGARAALKTETIEYKFGDSTFAGYVAWDDAESGKRPGVLVIHEWWGLNDYAKRRADSLARMGYVAFAPDLYGSGKVATSPDEAKALTGPLYQDRALLRSRMKAALQMLAQRPEVDAEKLGAIGYCFGGMCVLELARSGAQLAGVVSFHGGLTTPNPADAKNIQCRVLAEHGGADPNVKPEDVAAFMKEMTEGSVQWKMDIYGGAVHAFTNPAAGSDPQKGSAYNADADRRSWAAMKTFFGEIFIK